MIPTGLTTFDTLTGGLSAGGVTLIAGNAGVGVTTFCRSLALAISDSGHHTVWMPGATGRPEVLQLATALTSRRQAQDLGRLIRAPLVVQPVIGCSLADVVELGRLTDVLIVDDIAQLGRPTEVIEALRSLEASVVAGLRIDVDIADIEPEATMLTEAGVDLKDLACALIVDREDQRDPLSPRCGELDLWRVSRPRQRRARVAVMAHQPHYARVVDLHRGGPFDRQDHRRNDVIELLRSWEACSSHVEDPVAWAGDGLAKALRRMFDIGTQDVNTEA